MIMPEKNDEVKKRGEYKLSINEQKFVAFYIETGDLRKAVEDAGFKTGSPMVYGRKLLTKKKIQKEIDTQMALLKNDCIASANEILIFETEVMRGKIKDQFGLDATLADRMKAAEALAKRQIDMKALAEKSKENEITLNLVWDRSNDKFAPSLPAKDEDSLSDEVDE